MTTLDPAATQVIRASSHASRRIKLECIELEVTSGPEAGMRAKISLPSIKIGTAADNDVVLTDRTVSRHHAEIRITAQGLVVQDLDSTNGTFCNDVRVVEAFLQPDVRCSLGQTDIRITQCTEEHPYEISHEKRLGHLVGATEPMRELYGLLRAVAPSPTTILITGESGSGKEVVARTLHDLSGRRGPLVVFDASVTDPEMVRNDLFGHVKGAFTGALGAREGAFRRADGGTLFIDEIGELPLELQPRLLRALESREVLPVGSDQPVKVNVRVVAATHRDLEAMVQQGSFRADLFFRLSVITVRVPPLREIKDDIPLLMRNFLSELGLQCRLSRRALSAMYDYDWPGNVRELRNVLERATVLCQGQEIEPEHLRLLDAGPSRIVAPEVTPGLHQPASAASAPAQLKTLERQMIKDAIERNGNNKAAAARELGIPLSTLKRRIAEYQI
ncbi:MAG: sigma 54-dependent Fis family transcriptional regulator [Chromatiaceae bacterium]|jgi:DNA-binding NtrC family response regulator